MNRFNLFLFCFLLTTIASGADSPAVPDTRMPPKGLAVSADDKAELSKRVAELGEEIERLKSLLKAKPELLELLPDVQIFYNAVRYDLEDDIFYFPSSVSVAKTLLKQGRERARLLREGQAPWNTATGLVVRGFVSRIDGSVQPYGLVVPESYHAGEGRRHRLDFWLHGRENKLSEHNFIYGREKQKGEFTPDDTFVLHPYGRYCNADRFAGETDVFEALAHVRRHYPIAEDHISMRGFSMGGAAAWELGTHFAGMWAAVAPGAGFVETAIFLNAFGKKPYPSWYEQKLWHIYDAQDYAGNLFNCGGVVAYSGEKDGQKQAADFMVKAMAAEGLTMEHVIGLNTGHQFETNARVEVARKVGAIADKGRDPFPRRIKFTTWTTRYNQMKWVTIDGLEQHWNRARVDAEIVGARTIRVDTTNVSALSLAMAANLCPLDAGIRPTVRLDNQDIIGPSTGSDHAWTAHFQKKGARWSLVKEANPHRLHKQHGLQGPIDDAFMDSFIMVRPTGKPQNPEASDWIADEMKEALTQWRLQFRGEARVKDDTEVTDADIESSNLVLWGDPRSNKLLARIASRLPIRWNVKTVRLGDKNFPADKYVPVLIYPNPLNPRHYVVVNSGFTFNGPGPRSNNSAQTPKLPDYAILDTKSPSTVQMTNGVPEAGFFDEHWRFSTVENK